ncbi:MAG: tetratricopeptide repeat protein, partial [Acidobacteria bacterium]|nr:tetratricopeptide repeat protein [Acidobacteriota bacterium]
GLATVMRALGRAGIVLRNAGQLAEARTLFLEAVDLDSEAPPTLHLLGTVDEKLGQYGLAAKYFSRLVEVAAEDPTGRLRLALVESRRGRFDDARRLFEELLVEPVPDWVEAVAFEELARVEIETGHLGKALEVLDAGLQRHPFDQQLVLLRTWLQGDRSEAGRRALAEIRPSSSEQTETSARVRYNEWPTEEVAGFLLRMEEDVASSLPELRRALKLAEIIPRASSGSVEPW